jgi:hypothetical protein
MRRRRREKFRQDEEHGSTLSTIGTFFVHYRLIFFNLRTLVLSVFSALSVISVLSCQVPIDICISDP